MNVFEGMYGTSKSSYLKLEGGPGGGARMIVRHSQRVDPEKFGARGRYVESVFIENSKGERMLLPTTQLAPARAMAQHVNHGGSFADAVGSQIMRMAQNYADLSLCTRHIRANAEMLPESAKMVHGACRSQISKMRKTFERMYRPNGYIAEAAKINDAASALVEGENSPDILPEYVVKRMRGLMAVEGIEIPDRLIEAAYRACRCEVDEHDETLDDTAAGEPSGGFNRWKNYKSGERKNVEQVSVFGKKVDKDAWMAFGAGHIELKRPLTDTRTYGDKTAEFLGKMQDVAKYAVNDSLGNLISYASDELENSKDRSRVKSYILLGKAAIRAAGLSLNEGIPMKSEAVREFADWIDSTKGIGTDAPVDEQEDGLTEPELLVDNETDGVPARKLSREDILFPSSDQRQSFKNDVIKPTVTNPETGEDETPDSAYIDDLRRRAGMHNKSSMN